jgi:hypothetical protein
MNVKVDKFKKNLQSTLIKSDHNSHDYNNFKIFFQTTQTIIHASINNFRLTSKQY